jgi:hypothetical protein
MSSARTLNEVIMSCEIILFFVSPQIGCQPKENWILYDFYQNLPSKVITHFSHLALYHSHGCPPKPYKFDIGSRSQFTQACTPFETTFSCQQTIQVATSAWCEYPKYKKHETDGEPTEK